VGALYLEDVSFQYLYYEPPELSRSARGQNPRTWLHPVRKGRWTPGWEPAKAPPTGEAAPDPREFL
jgi:hypothetical protein